MDNVKKLDEYLDSLSKIELAELIDYILRTQFNDIDKDFSTYYQKELQRFRKIDALSVQVKLLKKVKNQKKRYEEELPKYRALESHSDKLLSMYNHWKEEKKELKDEKKKIGIILRQNLDMETFYEEQSDNIRKKYPQISPYLSLNLVKKMIRSAADKDKNEIKEKYKLVSPQFPILMEDFKKDKINTKYSVKTAAELLCLLEKSQLRLLTEAIRDALENESTDDLKATILFVFCHRTSSCTKGKEYARTDAQVVKDPSKTNGKNFSKLYKEYLELLDK